MMYRDKEVCRAVYEGVPKGMIDARLNAMNTIDISTGTPVFGLAGTIHEETAKELGLPVRAGSALVSQHQLSH